MPENELMDLTDICTLYRCSRRHARDVVIKALGFPELAPGATSRNMLWLRTEVTAFVQRRHIKSLAPEEKCSTPATGP